MGLVWLGAGIAGVGLIGAMAALNKLAQVKREALEDSVAQQYLRYTRFFLAAMSIGAIVAVVSALAR